MRDDDLYTRHQTLAALVNVLLHDLRNPLHSGTLLVEAMASRTADIDSIRGKMRAQLGKLEALISEASGSIREISLEPRIERVEVDDLLRAAVARLEIPTGEEAAALLPHPTGLTVATDRAILTQAVVEIASGLQEHEQRSRSAPAKILLQVEQPDSETVKILVGNTAAPLDPAVTKAPFAIAGGGMRLAVARSLCQTAAATLRLEQTPDSAWRFGITVQRQA